MSNEAEEIAEFRDLTQNFDKSAALMRRAIRMLLEHQFVFAGDRGCGEIYDLLVDPDCTGFFGAYFACAGYRLEVDRRDGMVGLLPNPASDTNDHSVMKADETAILLLCCQRFQDAIVTTGMVEGGAQWDTNALNDAWRNDLSTAPPPKARILDLLRGLKERNLVGGTIPQSFGDGFPFVIRPSVTLVVTGDPVQKLIERLGARQTSQRLQNPITDQENV